MPESRPFAHLHCHTHYSLLDGMTQIPDLVRSTKEMGMNAVAITDHGNMYGAREFYSECRANDINPIVGMEAYIAPRSRKERGGASRVKEASFHLTLLAMNRQGFQNLVKLSSLAYLEGFYYKPRIDKEILEEMGEGLICLSGCAAGELSHYILGERQDEATELVRWYERVFGDRFYMEIQDSGTEIQRMCKEGTVDLAQKLGFPLVATNDAHYLCEHDANAHDVLLCVNTHAQRGDTNRMKMETEQFFVRSPEDMYAAFPGFEDAVARSQEIADRCDIQLEENPKYYPVFTPPDQKTDTEYLREVCEEALVWRYGEGYDQKYQDRLDLELGVIEHMGYSSYFLIVWDFVQFAKKNDIPCTARGSASGAIVTYLLGLSDHCPIEFGLLFERFLDKSRKEPPDIDIDFCRDRRQLVIDYTKEKYGEQCVAQIGTFGTLKAKAVVRDVGRALGVPLPRVNEIAKMVPDTLGIKLKDAVNETAELKQAYDSDPQIKELIEIAYRLEGLARSAGTHAAGVVVADQPLMELLPLQVITGKADIITQWDGPTVEDAGLLKMDFLGLRNLTILDKAVKNVKQHRGVEIVPHLLPLEDEQTYQLLQRGETKGIFQLESGGMRDLLTKMKPDSFNDIIATSALYRPGPLEGGMVMDYVNVKNGRQEPAKVHPLVDEVLEETYGVMVYQEQVMQILNRVGGLELASAYRCIKAISKKKLKIIADFREEYVSGAKKQGIDERVAVDLFELIEKFAGYGFNKSHSTAYAAIAYQTAYLKAHYPEEFMAALLSCGMESSDRINEHVDDARRMKIEVLPPDVNTSDVEFSVVVVDKGAEGERRVITFGMGAIKGIGENVVQAIVDERTANGPFTDIFDLTERVDPKVLTKGMLEILVKAGALDSLGGTRAQYFLVVERAVQASIQRAKDKAAGQKNLFGGDDEPDGEEETASMSLPETPDWGRAQKLAAEKEVLGFYLTSHPLAEAGDRVKKYSTHDIKHLADLDDGAEVLIGGMVGAIKYAQTKKPSRNGHSKYVNFDFEDESMTVRCIMWPEEFHRYGEQVKAEEIFYLRGRVDRRGREPNIIVNKLLTLDDAEREFTAQVVVRFRKGLHEQRQLTAARDALQRFPGETDIVILVESADPADPDAVVRYRLMTPGYLRVTANAMLRRELTDILGEEFVRFHSPSKRRVSDSGSNGQGRTGDAA
ncbi:DNA polymerase III subunit alpha [Stratiformator vulcanicus]|uniref:DNA polymerase III subunit alpha n=1 Tax=Stratiformator vulcanicus TaxID=2527980 RepID=A0A517R273_9PLAN|nr:DNA polymerase III subunit alpha [Stratiformator vulcanicus]QDT37987.1 DNA polymerase III subunit alpha [Stratiformator vulcanicus]